MALEVIPYLYTMDAIYIHTMPEHYIFTFPHLPPYSEREGLTKVFLTISTPLVVAFI